MTFANKEKEDMKGPRCRLQAAGLQTHDKECARLNTANCAHNSASDLGRV